MAKLNFIEYLYMHLWWLCLWCISIALSLVMIVRGILNNMQFNIDLGILLLAFLIAGLIIANSSKYTVEFSW